MLQKLKSPLILIIITIERVTDHLYRYITGLPQAKKSMITPFLYLGGQYSPQAFERLKLLGITGIVNMREISVHKDISGLKGIKILNLPTKDQTAPTQEALRKGVEFITKEILSGGKVYVHCRFGEGRGPTMIIAYLISTGLTFEDAESLVRKVRTFIKPTPSQIAALREFENSLLA